jgi:hypothetical protein
VRRGGADHERPGRRPKRQAEERLAQIAWITGHLTDIASDLSAFHRIDDPEEMDFAVFCALAYRLPAYQGAMAAVVAQQRHGASGGNTARRPAQGQRYERAQQQPAVTPRNAEDAPPATASSLAALNAQLGAVWFSHRTLPRDGGDA